MYVGIAELDLQSWNTTTRSTICRLGKVFQPPPPPTTFIYHTYRVGLSLPNNTHTDNIRTPTDRRYTEIAHKTPSDTHSLWTRLINMLSRPFTLPRHICIYREATSFNGKTKSINTQNMFYYRRRRVSPPQKAYRIYIYEPMRV